MTYAERLAEFVKVTGHKPGEMNKVHATFCPHVETLTEDCPRCLRRKGTLPNVSLEPPAQSAGPGRCGRYTRAAALGDPKPCVLDDGHEGGHEL